MKQTNVKNKKDQADAEINSTVLVYEKPILIIYGDVRDITLGPTVGLGESGCEFDRQVGSPLSCP